MLIGSYTGQLSYDGVQLMYTVEGENFWRVPFYVNGMFIPIIASGLLLPEHAGLCTLEALPKCNTHMPRADHLSVLRITPTEGVEETACTQFEGEIVSITPLRVTRVGGQSMGCWLYGRSNFGAVRVPCFFFDRMARQFNYLSPKVGDALSCVGTLQFAPDSYRKYRLSCTVSDILNIRRSARDGQV